jgi:phenylacetate-CoA ligase
MFAIPGERVARVHTSSGTTGKPTVVGDTPNDNDTRAKLVARSFRAGAVRPGMNVHSAVGCGLLTGGLGCPRVRSRSGAVASGMTGHQVQLSAILSPTLPTPSYLLVILDQFRGWRRAFDRRAMLDTHLLQAHVEVFSDRDQDGAASALCIST